MCIPANATCPGGASIGCLESGACSNGSVCCLSLLGGTTSCVLTPICTLTGGVVLCTSSAQCPGSARNCCRFGQTGICRAQACP
jgi:hypothetical protein